MESTSTILRLPRSLRAEIEFRASRGYPQETGGLLLGRSDGGRIEVLQLASAHDGEGGGERCDLDPDDLSRARSAARELGMEVVGVWRSHPDQPARPPRTEGTEGARAGEGWSYLIVSVGSEGTGELRSWRLDGSGLREEEVAA